MCNVCHSNCPFSITTPGHVWTELLLNAMPQILLFHYTRKQHLKESPKCHHIRHYRPLKHFSHCARTRTNHIRWKLHKRKQLQHGEEKSATRAAAGEREGEEETYARSKVQYPVVGAYSAARRATEARAHCEPSGPSSLLPMKTRITLPLWSLTTTQGQHTLPDL